MNEIGFFNEAKASNIDDNYVISLANYVLNDEKVSNAELNIIIVDNKKIREINKNYRGKDYATDVISFALEDEPFIKIDKRILGDIYISFEKIGEQAKAYNHSFKRELSFLVVHGLLHLLGYDHENIEDEKIMFERQEKILDEYGIKR